ncbi:e3 ubiquitin-protein ligase COP1 [Trichonephila clavipes]|nr:e3 ubiquitin-protein ligase COP1 [Trichonephila clavipes]
MLNAHTRLHPKPTPNHPTSNHQNNIHTKCEPSTSKNSNTIIPKISNLRQHGFNGSRYVNKILFTPTLTIRRKRVNEHFDDLKQSYLNYRSKDILCPDKDQITCSGLDSFDEDLGKFVRYNSVRPLATLNYSADNFVGSTIVSSIEFDKDNEYFAIAGVTKKIKVFEYAAVIRDTIDMHYPSNEMVCNSKISCISWSSFHKNMLASSDYDGTVTLWDAFTNQKIKTYQEHEKRCWSVDFNRVDTQLIASGSDDAKVKLWTTNMEHSFATLEAKANVCCVKFNPESRNYLAFGSAGM